MKIPGSDSSCIITLVAAGAGEKDKYRSREKNLKDMGAMAHQETTTGRGLAPGIRNSERIKPDRTLAGDGEIYRKEE